MHVTSVSAASATDRKRRPLGFQDIGREHKRRFILQAAAAVFGAKGFHAATVKDIAETAGIAHGTSLYFKDKKDGYFALSHEFQSRIMEAILPGGEAAVLADGTDLPWLVRERLAGFPAGYHPGPTGAY